MKIKNYICPQCGDDDLFLMNITFSHASLCCKNCEKIIKILDKNERDDVLMQVMASGRR